MPWATYRSNRVKFCSLIRAVRAPPPRHLVRFGLLNFATKPPPVPHREVHASPGRQRSPTGLRIAMLSSGGRQRSPTPLHNENCFPSQPHNKNCNLLPSLPHNEDGALLSVSRTKRKLCSDLAFRLSHISRIVFCFPYQGFRLLSWLAPASTLAREAG